ncbi:MAG: hypothetical protein AB7M12_04745 [Hyphomonadaceae bacterium]
MKSSALFGLSATLAIAAGCAPVAKLGGAPLERHVLAKAGPAKLAKALAADLGDPGYDAFALPPEVLALRGVLDDTVRRAEAGRFPLFADALIAASDAPAPVAALAAPTQIAPPPEAEAEAGAAAPAIAPDAKPTYAVALGRFGDAAQALAIWRELAAADPLAVKGLAPRVAAERAGGVTLLAGPLPDSDTAAGRCTAFTALGVACAPAPFRGKSAPDAAA